MTDNFPSTETDFARLESAKRAAIELHRLADFLAQSGSYLGAQKARSVARELARTHGFEVTIAPEHDPKD